MNLMNLRPSFWDPRNIRNPAYRPNLGRAIEEGLRVRGQIMTVSQQAKKGGKNHGLTLIDYETDFGDTGRLPVMGTFDDVERLGERIIRGVIEEHYTHIIASIDIHPTEVIHGETWWRDEMGNMPDVSVPLFMTLIDDSDPGRPVFEATWVDGRPAKKFRPRYMSEHTMNYAKHLTATGQGNIWVFTAHCRQGTDGINLIPALAELLEWASVARGVQVMFMYKGQIAHVDWFGPYRPCMDVPDHPQGGIQTFYLDINRLCETMEYTGEAEDFCVNAGVRQSIGYYEQEPDMLSRMRFIGDCTSAIVPGSQVVKDLHRLMKDKGVRVIKHNDPFG